MALLKLALFASLLPAIAHCNQLEFAAADIFTGEEGRLMEKLSIDDDCRRSAYDSLHSTCNEMSEESKRKLAVKLANCHLEGTGRETFSCSEEMSVRDCAASVSHEQYMTLTEFFLHADSMCREVQHALWRERAQAMIANMEATATDLLSSAQDSLEQQRTMLGYQEQSLENDARMIANEERLLLDMDAAQQRLHTLQGDVDAAFDGVMGQLHSQRQALDEAMGGVSHMLDYIAGVQHLLLGEMMDAKTVLYYVTSLTLAWLLTTTAHTGPARLWMFAAITTNFAVERVALAGWAQVSALLAPSAAAATSTAVASAGGVGVGGVAASATPADVTMSFYTAAWLLRKLVWGVCASLLVATALRYRDLNRLNHGLLLQMQKDVQRLLGTGSGVGAGAGSGAGAGASVGECTSKGSAESGTGGGGVGPEEEAWGDDGDWVPSDVEEEEDCEEDGEDGEDLVFCEVRREWVSPSELPNSPAPVLMASPAATETPAPRRRSARIMTRSAAKAAAAAAVGSTATATMTPAPTPLGHARRARPLSPPVEEVTPVEVSPVKGVAVGPWVLRKRGALSWSRSAVVASETPEAFASLAEMTAVYSAVRRAQQLAD